MIPNKVQQLSSPARQHRKSI